MVTCPVVPAPSERMLRAHRSTRIWLEVERKEWRLLSVGADVLQRLGCTGSHWCDGLVPEGTRQSLEAELLLG